MSAADIETTPTRGEQSIGLRQAVQIAREYLQQLFSEKELAGARLEETGRNMDGDWEITFSLKREGPPIVHESPGVWAGMSRPVVVSPRDYKLITIDEQTGKVLSMTIRQL